ncbi:MAG: DUF2784 domain-containing protein [Halioglobus sp.]|nr:DUF2784 domain-containing protein [Halioglobus sp.]
MRLCRRSEVNTVSNEVRYLIAADALLFVHALIVAFVVLGLLLVFVGGLRGWAWIRNFWFRLLHLTVVVFVVLQTWAGEICPFTEWEMAYRTKAGETIYAGSFVAHWVESLLYYQAPGWVFVVIYTLFGCLVIASWLLFAPRLPVSRH